MSKKTKLNPCKSCGKDPSLHLTTIAGLWGFTCSDCSGGTVTLYTSLREAERAWNKENTIPEPQEPRI